MSIHVKFIWTHSAPLHHRFRRSCAVSWSVDNDRSDLGKKRNKEEKETSVEDKRNGGEKIQEELGRKQEAIEVKQEEIEVKQEAVEVKQEGIEGNQEEIVGNHGAIEQRQEEIQPSFRFKSFNRPKYSFSAPWTFTD